MSNLLGYIPDVRDERDKLFSARNKEKEFESVDLSGFIESVNNQNYNDCVLNAISSALAIRSVLKGGRWLTLSRLYGYYYARKALGDFGKDQDGGLIDDGCRPRDALRVYSKLGAIPEKAWDYKDSNLNRTPPFSVRRRAIDFEFAYNRCSDSNDIKSALTDGFPVTCGLAIDGPFQKLKSDEIVTGFGESIGNHMMLIVGWSKEKKAFLILNSWGEGWGKDGYCWISENLVQSKGFDKWAII